jgi:HlyD family secretion protein
MGQDGATLGFQTELDRIARERPPLALRLVTLALALALAVAVGLASLLRVDIVVSGHGKLAADHPTNVVMPLERAILRSIDVHMGDVVRRGQLLAVLDSTFTQADLNILQSQVRVLQAEVARLTAEQRGEAYHAGAYAEEALQTSLFAQRQREYRARLDGFVQALEQDHAAQATARHQAASLAHQVDVASEVRRLRGALMQRAVGSRLQFLDADAAYLRASNELKTTSDRQLELAQEERMHRADAHSYIEGWRRDVAEALAAKSAALAQTEAARAKAARLQDLVRILAPEDGTVLDVAARGPGSVLREAEPLLTLLPAHAGLIAEVAVKSSDIGFVRAGDPASIKIDAYPYQKHGALSGHVRSIAAASADPPAGGDGAAVHRVSVALSDVHLAELPEGAGPMPGMTVTADVRVGTRSVMAYFLAPITRGFSQSLREP